jgi:CRP-like cAMP-binding protein
LRGGTGGWDDRASMSEGDERQTVLHELRKLPLCEALQRCDPHGLTEMAALGRTEEVPAGTRLFALGEPADDVRFVLSGRIALVFDDPSGEHRTVGTASEGDLLGWSALRSADATWTLTAHATKPSRCLVFPGAALRELCDRERTFGYCLMRYAFEVVAERLTDVRLQALDLYGRPP